MLEQLQRALEGGMQASRTAMVISFVIFLLPFLMRPGWRWIGDAVQGVRETIKSHHQLIERGKLLAQRRKMLSREKRALNGELPEKPLSWWEESIGRLRSLDLFRLLREFRHMRFFLVVPATLFSLFDTYLGFERNRRVGKLMDEAIRSEHTMWTVFEQLRLVIALFAAGWFAQVLSSILFARARWELTLSTRSGFVSQILSQDLSFFDRTPTRELAGRLRSEPDQLHELLHRVPERLVKALFNIGMGLRMMFSVDTTLACLAGLLRAPLTTQVILIANRIAHHYGRVQKDALRTADNAAAEAIENVHTVQAHAAEEIEVGLYKRKLGEYLRVVQQSVVVQMMLRFTEQGLEFVIEVILLGWAVRQLSLGYMTMGAYTSFRLYAGRYKAGFSEVRSLFNFFKNLAVRLEQYFDVMERIPPIRSNVGRKLGRRPRDGARSSSSTTTTTTEAPFLRGNVEFKGVSFRYPIRPDVTVLHDVSFRVRPGEVVALVGPSGSGKTSIVRLLQRFYDPTAGSIEVDGVDIRDLHLRWFRRTVGYVDQEPVLFDRSIEENVGYGIKPTPSRQEIERACMAANAHDFICALPDGYETRVGERGAQLSGGQKQRVAIARALIRDPAILLLDEATSSLDATNESLVQSALDQLMEGRTTVMIAHRLATVQRADRILVIQKGEIVECGTHDDLCRKDSGLYASLVQQQQLRFATDVGDIAAAACEQVAEKETKAGGVAKKEGEQDDDDEDDDNEVLVPQGDADE